jgi:hypothetical protein
MSLYRAAKRYDRGFVAPVLVAKAHIEMPFSDLLDSFSRDCLKNSWSEASTLKVWPRNGQEMVLLLCLVGP